MDHFAYIDPMLLKFGFLGGENHKIREGCNQNPNLAGAERLDGYLYFQVEESIRTLVHSVTYDKVNDLRSEFSGEMLRTLQSKVG